MVNQKAQNAGVELLMFDLEYLPDGITANMVQAINERLPGLHARKVPSIDTDPGTEEKFAVNWARLYLQTHIRRSLSLIEGGYIEWKAGRTIVSSLCTRALLEDAAVFHYFIAKLTTLLKAGDWETVRAFISSRAFSNKRPLGVDTLGVTIDSTNILTFIGKMNKLNAGFSSLYDDLSEVCHPNGIGVMLYFGAFQDDDIVTFDDGEKQSYAAIGHLLAATYLFICILPELEALEELLARAYDASTVQ